MLLRSIILLALCATLAQTTRLYGQDAAKPWFARSLVGMEVGPTGAHFGYSDPTDQRYCARWNGAEIVRESVKANAEYLVLWLRDGDFAYYNSKLLTKAPGLGERDPLQEALQEARRHKLPIISYCVVQQAGNFFEKHPEWSMKAADGSKIGRFCYNSGYLEAMKKIVAEQLAYGIDGFHIDMLDQGFGPPYGCWCDSCKRLFEARYQTPMPNGATWDANWEKMLEFRYDTSERFEKQLTAYIKSLNPQATVDYNYHGSPPFSIEVGQRPVQHAGNGDFVTGETGVWGFSALGVGLNAEFYRAATPGLPYQVAIQRGVRMYHDQTTRPLHDMRWETLTLLSHGAFVTMIDKTAFDGSLDPVAYGRIGRVLAEAREKREHFGQPPVYDIGLYFSSRTRDWIAREQPSRYFQSFLGAHQACAMEHLQFGVVLDESVTAEKLRRFPVVCLPNVGILSTRELKLLRDYVESGGGLIVTGQTGQFGPRGEPLKKPPINALIGGEVVKRLDSHDNWVSVRREEGSPLADDLRNDWKFLVKGPATVYRATRAKALGSLYEPDRTTRQREGRMHTNWPMSAGRRVGPAALVHRLGRGVVVTSASSPDFAAASEHALVENRTLFRNLFRSIKSRRRVMVNAPSNVEAVVTDDRGKKTLRVHLLGYNATPRTTPATNRPFVLPGLIEDKPIFRATIQLNQPPRSARSLNESTLLIQDGNTVRVTVEDIHDVVVIDYGP